MATLTLSDKLDQLGTRYDELTRQLSTSESLPIPRATRKSLSSMPSWKKSSKSTRVQTN